MIRKTMGIAAAVFVVLALALITPVSALDCGCVDVCVCGDDSDNVVSMTTGVSVPCCGDAPIIKAKFEKEAGSWEDGDPCHEMFGSQFLPACGDSTNIEIYAAVSDPEGIEDIASVYYRVIDPCGDVIAEGCMGPICGGYEYFETADSYSMVWWNECFDIEELQQELCVCPTAVVYGADFDLGYCDPAGDYFVEVWALDKGGLYSQTFGNIFTMVRLPCCDYDFTSIDWGSVKVNQEKVVPGNDVFCCGDGYPTIKNLGNVDIKMKVKQSDLFLNCEPLGKDCCGDWQVAYDARLTDGAKAYFYPEEWVTLDGIVERCGEKGICFSIKILNYIPVGDYSGTLYLECIDSGLNPCDQECNLQC